ncbi:hypothetical protein FRB91_005391 [Serendipita sp. 411]|nr:hypothetical protein FRB91_005391 [Serendipita sp. 411]
MAFATNAVVDELVEGLKHAAISRYLCGVALILSIYDWLLLLGQESETIWKGRWTLPKGIYYFNRVVTPIGLVVAAYQLTDLRTEALSTRVYTFVNSLVELLSFFLANWLFTLRLVALYKRKRAIVWFLYSFLITSYLVTAAFMVVALYTFGLSIHYSHIFHACGSTTRATLMPAIFLAPAAFEVTLFFLTGYRAWQDAKLISSSSHAPFLIILYRDGIVCFFVMFAVRLWNVWIYATQPLTAAYLGIYVLWTTMTLLSTRVYLNLVYLARGGTEDTEVSVHPFHPPTRRGGIKMRVQTTTFADTDHIISFGGQGRRPNQLDSSFGIDTTLPTNGELPWERRPSKESEFTRDSLDERPFTSKSYAENHKSCV